MFRQGKEEKIKMLGKRQGTDAACQNRTNISGRKEFPMVSATFIFFSQNKPASVFVTIVNAEDGLISRLVELLHDEGISPIVGGVGRNDDGAVGTFTPVDAIRIEAWLSKQGVKQINWLSL